MEERERDRMIAEALSNIATGALLTQGPLVLIGAVGLWFAFATRGRHAYVSAVAAVGFGLLIVFALSQVLIQFLVELRGLSVASWRNRVHRACRVHRKGLSEPKTR
jgi:hypothetical protein